MARVNVDSRALTDPRFTELGILLTGNTAKEGFSHHALGLGVMIHVWNECLERGCHALPDVTLFAISRQLGIGCDHLSVAICEAGLGEEAEEMFHTRIKGTEGRIEWLDSARQSNRERQKRHRDRNAVSNALVTPPSRGVLAPALSPAPALKEKTTTLSDPPAADADATRVPRLAPATRTRPSPLVNGERVKALEGDFATLYEFYPRHVGRQAAWRSFVKLDPDLDTLQTIARDVKRRTTSGEWMPDDPERVQFIPHLATYLNQRRWSDEA